MVIDTKNILNEMLIAGAKAREAIMKIYNQGFDIEIKSDNSPVTQADKEADRIIREYLHEKFPKYAFLTEESEDNLSRLDNPCVFIVDPVDGTKDFCAKNGEFATNIAFAYEHEIVVGVVYIPARGDVYYAVKGEGSYHITKEGKVEKIHVNDKLDDLTLLTSRFHSTDFEKNLPSIDKRITKVMAFGSSIKACHIAQGLAEVHYRTNEGTKEWDIAPIDLIVTEAGGIFLKPNGEKYKYNRRDVYNHEGYVVANRIENVYKINK